MNQFNKAVPPPPPLFVLAKELVYTSTHLSSRNAYYLSFFHDKGVIINVFLRQLLPVKKNCCTPGISTDSFIPHHR